eukprot:scaffold3278_cov52-Phaeocystis_antarctica.AAC.1
MHSSRREEIELARDVALRHRTDSWGGMARLFGTPAARPTVGRSVWRRREARGHGRGRPRAIMAR